MHTRTVDTLEAYLAYKPVVPATVSAFGMLCHRRALLVVPMLPRRPEGPLAQPIVT